MPPVASGSTIGVMTVFVSYSLLSTCCAPKPGEVSLTLCMESLEMAWLPRPSAAAAPPVVAVIVPLFRANAPAEMLRPSPSESSSTTV